MGPPPTVGSVPSAPTFRYTGDDCNGDGVLKNLGSFARLECGSGEDAAY
jgi:hypothetical protein